MRPTNIITWIPYQPIHPFLLGSGILGVILAILIWLLPVILLLAIIDWVFSPHDDVADEERYDSALEILKERYARGEISKREFEEKKHFLKQS